MLIRILIMDPISLSSPMIIIITFFIFMFMVLKLGRRASPTKSPLRLPPGPRKLPIIGNIHQLRGPIVHRTLRDLAKQYGPLMQLQLGEVSYMVVSSPEYAKEFMKTHDVTFATRPELLIAKVVGYDSSYMSLSPYNDYWRQIRKICAIELFSSKRIQYFKPVRENEVQDLIKWISANVRSPINLTEKIFASSYAIASRVTFGKKHKNMQNFEALVKKAGKLLQSFSLSDLYPSSKLIYVMSGMRIRLNRLLGEVSKILDDVLDEHKKRAEAVETGKKEENIVDILLKYEGKGRLGFHLTANNIKALISDLFAGGSETSPGVINWAMSEMMKNPRVMKKAQAEVRQVFDKNGCFDETSVHQLHYLKLVIKETLRLHAPIPLLLPRECREKCEINGYDIPFKTRVIINAWAIGRDPNHWSDAEKFFPERFLGSSVDFKGTNFEFIPFGAGRRICPGMDLATASVELFLAQILYHFDWKLPDGIYPEDLDMIETSIVATRRKDDLIVIPIPYKPSPSHQVATQKVPY